MKAIFLALASCCIYLTQSCWAAPNILMIAVDDLKPLLGAYGYEAVQSPHIDSLAKDGVVFTNAHCGQAVCGPSRASLLSGLRPDTTKVWDLKTRMRQANPSIVTIPQHFKDNGYETAVTGKIFDYRCVDSRYQHDAPSWSIPYRKFNNNPKSEYGHLDPAYVSKVKKIRKELKASGKGTYKAVMEKVGGVPAYEKHMDVPDEAYDDGSIAETGISLLKELTKKDKPFFLAVGFKKPHLPFVAPKKYWDLYKDTNFPPPETKGLPLNAPQLAFQDSWELNGSYVTSKSNGKFDPEYENNLRHGYHACVSYIDAQIGKLMAALKEYGVADSTIVILWGDHGFHLGDHGMWCKHTNYEQATRSPLIILDPRKKFAMSKSAEPVEFIDIFPTLCEMATLKAPASLEGKSLLPHMTQGGKHKEVAISQFSRHSKEAKGEVMGYAYRSLTHRYVEWVANKYKKGKIANAPRIAEELYDYQKDPLEKVNVANDPAYAETLAHFRKLSREMNISGAK
ncbi:MAG: sulfatase [Planctomycetes bacterium]|nr:sulfatase [Planctomycetota bacterium]